MSEGTEVVNLKLSNRAGTKVWTLLWRGRLRDETHRIQLGFWTTKLGVPCFTTLWVKARTEQALPPDVEFCTERAAIYASLSKELNKRCGYKGLFVVSIQPISRKPKCRKR